MACEAKYFEYLKSVNPISQKIGEDIDRIIHRNGGQWEALDIKSKEKLIDQSLINENLSQKYEKYANQDLGVDYGELSTFSWFTKSQLNLFTLINVKGDRIKSPLKKSDVLSPQKKTKAVIGGKGGGAERKGARSSKDEKPCPKKPKTPPPPPPARLVPSGQRGLLSSDLIDPDIPKTGFDFLDNW